MSVGQYLTPDYSTGCLKQSQLPPPNRPGDRLSIHATANDPEFARTGCCHADTPRYVGTHAMLQCWPPTKLSPPTAAVVVGLNREDVAWGKYLDQTMWRCDTELKLPCCNVYCICWTAHTDSINCLMFSLAPCCRCPLCDVRISPTLLTLVNRPTCLRLIAACNYGAVGPTRILG